MWVILVDHSGSMGEGFRQSAEQVSFRDRRTQQTVKLQAAVESVLIELSRLPARSDVTLYGFTSSARFLHRGLAGDHSGFETALRGLSAGGGTDIAAALDSARTQVSAARHPSLAPGLPEANRILLITDGLSDPEKARQAAQKCARDGLTVDVILIDPTDEARELTATVAGETNGRWEPVVGPDDLSRAAAEARTAMETEAQQTGEAARAIAAEAAAIRAERAARDAVLFRASHPGALTADAWYPLVVHVYAERMEGELKARLAELAPSLGPRPQHTEVPAGSAIAPGTELEIQPVIDHVRCRPPRIPVIWAEQLEEARFEIAYARPTGPGDVCHGDVLVLAGGLVIAKIPVSFQVTADGAAGRRPLPGHHAARGSRRCDRPSCPGGSFRDRAVPGRGDRAAVLPARDVPGGRGDRHWPAPGGRARRARGSGRRDAGRRAAGTARRAGRARQAA